ncbi:MAG TPA: thiamine diphosphokinase [Candidatus Limnocylindrales bacterium]|nr:thiamine diphosphokinase [Candidatus Limnocylindrales bacterium]
MSEVPQVPQAEAAIVIGDGDVPARGALTAAWPEWRRGVGSVVAADGGSRAAARLGLRLDLVVGDADSLSAAELEELRGAGIALELLPAEKDASDLELALRRALERVPGPITLLGALGGPRVEHALANVALLALPELAGRDVRILDARSCIRLLVARGAARPARMALDGRPGDHVSLFAWQGPADGVTTDGLRYPLTDEPLPPATSRGLSNEFSGPRASLSLRRGALLIVHTRRARSQTGATPTPRKE